ncbi:MAG TPA: hypothetical protein VMS12_05060 [Thermoanaerobaculia bacterium]|nr:hypothetical protein [Thermoanaerobaculia bacterium]
MQRPSATILITFVIFLAPPVYGYIDPGTGSMVLQLILGGVAGALVAGKLFWTRIAAFFNLKRTRKGSSD